MVFSVGSLVWYFAGIKKKNKGKEKEKEAAGFSDLYREGNDWHSYPQGGSHGDDNSDGIMERGNGSHHVRQTQGDHKLWGKKINKYIVHSFIIDSQLKLLQMEGTV